MPTLPPATITLGFDPFLRLGDSGVRLDTLAVAGAILVALAIAALVAGRTPVHDPLVPVWAAAVGTAAIDVNLQRKFLADLPEKAP